MSQGTNEIPPGPPTSDGAHSINVQDAGKVGGSVTGDTLVGSERDAFEQKVQAVKGANVVQTEAEDALDYTKGVVKIPNAHSKTAIARLTQAIKVPKLCVVEVVVKSELDGDWDPVEDSQRVRHAAVREWSERARLDAQYHPFIQEGVGKGMMCIIFYADEKQTEDQVRAQFKKVDNHDVEIEHIREPQEGNKVKCKVQCRLENSGTSVEVLRNRALNFLVRGPDPSKRPGFLELLPATKGDNNRFDPCLRGCSRSSESTLPSDYRLYLRLQPSIETNRLPTEPSKVPAETNRLLMNIDVVPCIAAKVLDKVILDMIGEEIYAIGKIEDFMDQIRKSLFGVQVRCRYVPPIKGSSSEEKAKVLDQSQMNNKEGRSFRIRGIRMPTRVETFEMKDGNFVDVYRYFTRYVLPEGEDLNDNLPLVQDGTKLGSRCRCFMWTSLSLSHITAIAETSFISGHIAS